MDRAPRGGTGTPGACTRVASLTRALCIVLVSGCAHGVASGGAAGGGIVYVEEDVDGAFAMHGRIGGHLTERFALLYAGILNLTLDGSLDDQVQAAHVLAGQVSLSDDLWVLAGGGIGLFSPFVGDIEPGVGLSQGLGLRIGPVLPAKSELFGWRPKGRLEVVLHASQSIPDGGVAFSLQLGVGTEPRR